MSDTRIVEQTLKVMSIRFVHSIYRIYISRSVVPKVSGTSTRYKVDCCKLQVYFVVERHQSADPEAVGYVFWVGESSRVLVSVYHVQTPSPCLNQPTQLSTNTKLLPGSSHSPCYYIDPSDSIHSLISSPSALLESHHDYQSAEAQIPPTAMELLKVSVPDSRYGIETDESGDRRQ